MTEFVTRQCEGHRIVTSGSLTCPSDSRCDPGKRESYQAYVFRHCEDHNLGKFDDLRKAERNLGLWCFWFYHKYIYGNPTLAPRPHWEVHAFIAESVWSEADLEQRKPMGERVFYLPEADKRRPGIYKRFKQCELPRETQKTSIGARAYSLFRHTREYFVNDRRNYREIIRSDTGDLPRETLDILTTQATLNEKIVELYGIWLTNCPLCSTARQSERQGRKCHNCGNKSRLRHRRIGLIDPSQGSRGKGKDRVRFRWLTEKADAVAAYSIWIAGLKTGTTGKRPDLYVWDDPQTEDNSDTIEKRQKINEKFDESVRQLEFDGELMVFDTRKYLDDFAGKISQEPLITLFHSLHRKARWETDEPDNAPWVVDGQRYYYPRKGDGKPALDKKALDALESQMRERKYAAEYLNDPLDQSRALFKRAHFKIVPRDDAPPEITYGLGCDISPLQQAELDHLGLKIVAYNACDPAGIEIQKRRGDDNFIVGVRFDRYGRWYVTVLSAGKWASRRRWDEVARASIYNRAQLTDYEMPASEIDVRDSYDKWVRDRRDELSDVDGKSSAFVVPIKFSHMPKSTKDSRIDQMEMYMPIYILDDAGSPELIEKYIGQWIGRGIADHDDGPDCTSRISRYVTINRYMEPVQKQEQKGIRIEDGAAHVPLSMIRGMMKDPKVNTLWGQQGGDPKCKDCGRTHSGACAVRENQRVA